MLKKTCLDLKKIAFYSMFLGGVLSSVEGFSAETKEKPKSEVDAAKDLPMTTVATLAGRVISQDDLRVVILASGPNGKMLGENAAIRKRFLNHLIESELLAKLGRDEKIDEDSAFKEKLEQAKTQLLARSFLEHYVKEKTTPDAVKKFYLENKKSFSQKEIRASHILIKNEEEAEKVHKMAQQKDMDFAKLAKDKSEGPSKNKGGDLGWFGPGRMVPKFDAAAFATPAGAVHGEVVKTKFGFHIIKVFEVRGEEEVPFDKIKEVVEKKLAGELKQKLIDDLKEKNNIVINKKAVEEMKF